MTERIVEGFISIHALLAESDLQTTQTVYAANNFYPRSPCGERRVEWRNKPEVNADFYPRSPCGERPNTAPVAITSGIFLSTLSLRRATVHFRTFRQSTAFLSTLSLRRATEICNGGNRNITISIHALLAESDKPRYPWTPLFDISIHALLAESDAIAIGGFVAPIISIHALLAESDPIRQNALYGRFYFYPRSPCGERRKQGRHYIGCKIFLSTLSLRRATAKVHKTVGHFCAYETNFMEIASSC